MIAELKGTVTRKSKDALTVYINGMGLEICVAPRLLESIPTGSHAHLFTRLVVREDSWTLYGFENAADRTCFDLLMTVKGIGPKLALGILSRLRPEEFYNAVVAYDERLLTGLPGVGKKTAARIVVELRDRIGLGVHKPEGFPVPRPDVMGEASEALGALGYSWQEARDALEKALRENPSCDLETLLREALKRLARV